MVLVTRDTPENFKILRYPRSPFLNMAKTEENNIERLQRITMNTSSASVNDTTRVESPDAGDQHAGSAARRAEQKKFALILSKDFVALDKRITGRNNDLILQVAETLDAHAWVETLDGKRVEPLFNMYEDIKRQRRLHGNPKYKAFDPKKDAKIIRKCKEVTKLAVRQLIAYHLHSKNPGQYWDSWVMEPDCCFLNAFVLQKIYGGTIIFWQDGLEDHRQCAGTPH